ncbi:MAG: autotransporter outer membrane beta-barrel domain-containing protein [Methyloligellaceae bacterium]
MSVLILMAFHGETAQAQIFEQFGFESVRTVSSPAPSVQYGLQNLTRRSRADDALSFVTTGMSHAVPSGLMELGKRIGDGAALDGDGEVFSLPPAELQMWGQGFGAVRDIEGSKLVGASTQSYAGIVTGIDRRVSPNQHMGTLWGAVTMTQEFDDYHRKTEWSTYFTGIYNRLHTSQSALDIVFLAGWTHKERERKIFHRRTHEFMKKVRGENDGLLVSVEAALTHDMGILGLVGQIKGRYAANFFDDFDQPAGQSEGQQGAATSGGRVQLAQGRLEISRPFRWANSVAKKQNLSPYLGLDYRHSIDGLCSDPRLYAEGTRLDFTETQDDLLAILGVRYGA